MTYEEIKQAAFLDELQKIAAANGGTLPGLEGNGQRRARNADGG